MYNLLRFIKLNQFLLLFLLIEGGSVFLLLQDNSYQANAVIKFSTQYTSFIHNHTTAFSDYIALKKTNNYLIEENAKLHSILKHEESFHDSILIKNKIFSYQSAKIINNSINKRNNFITLNKGTKHGIKEGIGVVTHNGVIGIIHSVSENYSIVISLLHRKSSVGIKMKKNNHNGILKWEGFDYTTANITNFPNHLLINKGDTIITNNHSIVFPEGINIGSIADFEKDEEGYYNVKVSLFEDFNQLNFVYVIHSTEAAEQQNLEMKITDE
jgi:rod shape-determining protein MreC